MQRAREIEGNWFGCASVCVVERPTLCKRRKGWATRDDFWDRFVALFQVWVALNLTPPSEEGGYSRGS